jgi:hypothetical protein
MWTCRVKMTTDNSGTTETTAEHFVLYVQDDTLWVLWKHATTVDTGTAARLVSHISRMGLRIPLPMLVQLNSMKSLSRCAMQTFARDLHVPAMALVGPSAVDRTLVDFFIQVHKPTYPVQHFTDPETAQRWLMTCRPHVRSATTVETTRLT